MIRFVIVLCAFVGLTSCNTDDNATPQPPAENNSYFPPLDADTWDTLSPENLHWDSQAIDELYDFLSEHNTRAFILIKDGKIVMEEYWGNTIANTALFDQNSIWYWASAGKTITSFLVGIAQEEGLLQIDDKTSDYLGTHWTSLPLDKEEAITIRHQLTMTTGLDYTIPNLDCTDPECLQYKSDAGNEWFYHNAPYTLLERVVHNASGISFNQFTDERLESKIGMSGTWIKNDDNNVYWSTARDAARFGLLILNNGKWDDEQIMNDPNYYNAMIHSSQELNPSYGYLWWLNGKNAIIYPGLPDIFPHSLAPNAPEDLFAAMGKNGQFIDIVPSENLVVIRFGEAPDDELVPVAFHNELWEKIGMLRN